MYVLCNVVLRKNIEAREVLIAPVQTFIPIRENLKQRRFSPSIKKKSEVRRSFKCA